MRLISALPGETRLKVPHRYHPPIQDTDQKLAARSQVRGFDLVQVVVLRAVAEVRLTPSSAALCRRHTASLFLGS